MTMSLDGFVSDLSGSPGRLAVDVEAYQASDQLAATVERTGAVVMGRRTFAMAPDPDQYAEHYEFQVPIFVVTHTPPARPPVENGDLTFTFLPDPGEAVARARAAAGERDVTVVGGPDLIGQLLALGLVDELEVDVVPVLLGTGVPLFGAATAGVPLEKVYVSELGQRTTLGFRARPGTGP